MLLADAIVFALLGVIWKDKDWLNMAFKVTFFGLAVASAFFFARDAGFIIQVAK